MWYTTINMRKQISCPRHCGLACGTGVVTVPATAVQAVAGTVCLLLLFYLFRVLRTMRWTPILLLFVSTGLLYTTGTLAAPGRARSGR